MATPHISILLQTFAGLGLPSTLCIPVPADSTLHEVHDAVLARLPHYSSGRYLLTTNNNRALTPCSSSLSSLFSRDATSGLFLPLRLGVPLHGGKGGFGSQLRAAGGRMSSRKKKKTAGEQNGSNRNLDGRRLRTVNEAKALAEYLAVKPEMERKEKEARRQRWEQIVEMAEQKEHEIRHGNKGRVDGAWIESKDEANERTREAVRAAMQQGAYTDTKFRDASDSSGASSSSDDEDNAGEGEGEGDSGSSSKRTTPPESATKGALLAKGKEKAPAPYFGFDEDDEFMSSDEEDADEDDTAES